MITRSAEQNSIARMRDGLMRDAMVSLHELLAKAQIHKGEYAPPDDDYDTEVQNRVDYVKGSMVKDLRRCLRRVFPLTWKKVINKSVTVPMVRYIYGTKIASTFTHGGDVSLVNSEGDLLPTDDQRARNLQDLINSSHMWAAFKRADQIGVVSNRVVVKSWWDHIDKKVRFDVYPMNHVYALVNEHAPWTMDACEAVAFYRGQYERQPCYEIWNIDRETGSTLLYENIGGQDKVASGEDESIPFVDPLTGDPIYPFVLVKYDIENDIYYLDDYGMLEPNRRLNEALTDIQYGWLSNMHPVQALESTGSSSIGGKAPSALSADPGQAVAIPEGWALNFKKPDTNTRDVEEGLKLVSKLAGRLNGVDVEVAFDSNMGPSSGVSIRIRRADLEPIVSDIKGIVLQPYTEAIRRAVIVHDYYHQGEPDKQINPDGSLDIRLSYSSQPVIDPAEVTDAKLPLVERNIYSVVDLRAELSGESREDAMASLERNKEENEKYSNRLTLEGIASPIPDIEEIESSEQSEDASQADTQQEQDEQAPRGVTIERVNVYEMARAIEVGAATAVDLRMRMFGEPRSVAQRRINEAEKFNRAMAEVQGERTRIEALAAGGAETGGGGTKPVKPIDEEAAKEAIEDLEEEVEDEEDEDESADE